jgi:hypothetical protein
MESASTISSPGLLQCAGRGRLPLVLLHAGHLNSSTRAGSYGSLAISGFPSQSQASSKVANWCSRRLKGDGRSF